MSEEWKELDHLSIKRINKIDKISNLHIVTVAL